MHWVLECGPGTLMHAVQMSGIYKDSKHFMDMPLKREHSAAALMQAFQSLPRSLGPAAQTNSAPDRAALQALLNEYLLAPGEDLEQLEPEDMTEEGPDWLHALPNQDLRAWVEQVYKLWSHLCRRTSDDVLHHPSHHSLLSLNNPFIIAGDRFREMYYWDSYWVVRGLVACDMRHTARDVAMNLLSLVDTVGHVPNGARIYYENRSQPPLLSAIVMVASGLQREGPGSPIVPSTRISQTGVSARAMGAPVNTPHSDSDNDTKGVDVELLRYALPRLIKTWQYWNTYPKQITVTCESVSCSEAKGSQEAQPEQQGQASTSTSQPSTSHTHTLSRYCARWRAPRPESYREDWCLASQHYDMTQPQDRLCAEQLWCEIASAAESGWDFSSRWCSEDTPADLASTRTTQIAPVDLNAFLALLASDISHIARYLGEASACYEFQSYAAERWSATHTLMWCEADGCWHDLLLSTHSHTAQTGTDQQVAHTATHGLDITQPVVARQLRRAVASNWVPLWAGGVVPGSAQAVVAVKGLQQSGLVQQGGVLTSLSDTGHQWDAPNAWPPLQHMLIEGLSRCGVAEGQRLAQDIASRWLRSAWEGYKTTGHMHEKYNAREPGVCGGGGEYTPQVGFGWTNGAVLSLLRAGYRP